VVAERIGAADRRAGAQRRPLQGSGIDKAFDTIKSNPDEAARKAAAEAINREFGAQVWNIWLYRALWGILQQPYVNGVQHNTLPEGSEGVGQALLGLHNINQTWCTDGKCE